MDKTRVLVVRYDNELNTDELKLFRGAVIASLGAESDPLFHHHSNDGFVYEYPKIQYKRIGGKAAIVSLDEGTDAIGAFFNESGRELSIGPRREVFTVSSIKAGHFLIKLWDESSLEYHLNKWLPLNQHNHREYSAIDTMVEKMQFLERMLTANILSLCKGLGITLDGEVKAKILEMKGQRLYTYKGVRMMGFDIAFRSNVSLPDYIGLGKGVSLGFGTIAHIRK